MKKIVLLLILSAIGLGGFARFTPKSDDGNHHVDGIRFKKVVYSVKIKTTNSTRLKKIVLD